MTAQQLIGSTHRHVTAIALGGFAEVEWCVGPKPMDRTDQLPSIGPCDSCDRRLCCRSSTNLFVPQVLYNDRSPMENHHVAAAFRLMHEDEQCDMFASSNPKASAEGLF